MEVGQEEGSKTINQTSLRRPYSLLCKYEGRLQRFETRSIHACALFNPRLKFLVFSNCEQMGVNNSLKMRGKEQ